MAGSAGWSSAFEHGADVPTKASLERLGPARDTLTSLSPLRKQLNNVPKMEKLTMYKKNPSPTRGNLKKKKLHLIPSFISPALFCALA